jgi:hypothetical protein
MIEINERKRSYVTESSAPTTHIFAYGSSVSFIPAFIVSEQNLPIIELSSPGQECIFVDGHSTFITHTCTTTVALLEFETVWTFYVLNDSNIAIFGRDFIVAHNGIVDYENNTITLNECSTQLTTCFPMTAPLYIAPPLSQLPSPLMSLLFPSPH